MRNISLINFTCVATASHVIGTYTGFICCITLLLPLLLILLELKEVSNSFSEFILNFRNALFKYCCEEHSDPRKASSRSTGAGYLSKSEPCTSETSIHVVFAALYVLCPAQHARPTRSAARGSCRVGFTELNKKI